MSNQAFDSLMSKLSDEDKQKILITAVSYGLEFSAPEWIPFAISQHGLLTIQKMIDEFGDTLEEKTSAAIGSAVDAAVVSIEAVRDSQIGVIQTRAEQIAVALMGVEQAAVDKITAAVNGALNAQKDQQSGLDFQSLAVAGGVGGMFVVFGVGLIFMIMKLSRLIM